MVFPEFPRRQWQDGVRLQRSARGMFAALFGQFAILVALLVPQAHADDFLAPARDLAKLMAAIEAERPTFTPPPGVTGISVPHHLLAADLIARGFWAASAGHYKRIVLISPDHFRKVDGKFATTREDLATVFGTVPSDPGADALLTRPDLFEPLESIDHEHGVMSLAPFIAHFFPGARIIPILASVNAKQADWRAAVELLRPLLGPDTLVVQSTDYSHYRPIGEAVLRDQETLAMIAAGNPAGVGPLLQPSHMDSKAAQFIQMALQTEVYRAKPVVLANRNSVEYGSGEISTTSYIVTAWLADASVAGVFDYPDQSRVFFGGDVLAGRYFLPVLHDATAWGVIADAVADATHNAPVILNLEGVLLDAPVTGIPDAAHTMLMEDTAPVLARFRALGASLANNHANDLGEVGRAESARLLSGLGIMPLEHGSITDFGAYRVLALNFVMGRFTGSAITDPNDLDAICSLAAAPPIVALVHWGTEYTSVASSTETAIASKLTSCGVSLIVGVHPHQASPSIVPLAGGRGQMVYSLGNLLFDQSSPRGSGALLEMRMFKQGTIATRLVPIPNLFDLGRAAMAAQ